MHSQIYLNCQAAPLGHTPQGLLFNDKQEIDLFEVWSKLCI